MAYSQDDPALVGRQLPTHPDSHTEACPWHQGVLMVPPTCAGTEWKGIQGHGDFQAACCALLLPIPLGPSLSWGLIGAMAVVH